MDLLHTTEEPRAPRERAQWERPVLRRLAANQAQHNVGHSDDGNCVGGTNHSHTCPS